MSMGLVLMLIGALCGAKCVFVAVDAIERGSKRG